MFLNNFILIIISVGVCFLVLAITLRIIDCRRKGVKQIMETDENSSTSNTNRVVRIRENYQQVRLNEITIGHISYISMNKFKASAREGDKIIEKENNCIYFNNNCVIQADYQTLDLESMYYEIELLDSDNKFELLIGYTNKSGFKIHETHILLNNKIYGVNINERQCPNTFVHTLKKGDIIGCFYDLRLDEITFTYNGSDLCYYKFQSNVIYPIIYSNKGTSLKYNFGNQPFHYRRANQLKLGLICNYAQEIPPSY